MRMRFWQQQIRTSDCLREAGFRWRHGAWCKDARMSVAEFDFPSAAQRIGRVNSDRWHGVEPHALQLVGVNVRRRGGNTVDVTYRLASRGTAQGLTTFTPAPAQLTAARIYGETAFRDVKAFRDAIA